MLGKANWTILATLTALDIGDFMPAR